MFEEMTKDYKASWRCPECMRAAKGNNADTEVRGVTLYKTFSPSEPSPNAPTGWNFFKTRRKDFVPLYSAIAAADWTPVYELRVGGKSEFFLYNSYWVPRKSEVV
ncbi:jg23240 [Pararge aegeria aegeria]|uniref:Jg23240 protein n=1 Tax=Pararge aegeria aegeria TaxID=348720 RepID=A0A8S4QHE5_9NEOP|nr:jg23240 [Pararge aegeria aegeria]